jgi:cysteine desulfurase/selenocysteine lyase
MTIDINRARRETPGCEKVLHFNNAGTSLAPQPVLDAVISHLQLEAEMGGYESADFCRDTLEHTYDSLAALVDCGREEIALAENATRAWDMLFYALPFGPGDRILTSMAEYSSNYIACLQVARRTGAVVEPIPNDEHGRLSIEALQAMMDERVKLVAVTHVPTNGGLVNPAEEVGRVVGGSNALYLLDACQSVGQMPVSVQECGCDMLTATGRKYLRGPRGTGFLYIRRGLIEILEPPFLDNFAAEWTSRDSYTIRMDARRFETWESYVAGRIGLGVAADYAMEWGLENIRERVTGLAELLRSRLAELHGVTVRDQGVVRCGIVTFTVEGAESSEIKARLGERGINISISPMVSTRLDMESRGLKDVLRASVHYYNTEDEIDRFIEELNKLLP